MSQDDVKQSRSWRDIAKQAAAEHDPNRVLQLAHELIAVLDKESNERMEHTTAKQKGAA